MCKIQDILLPLQRLVGEKTNCNDPEILNLELFKHHNRVGYSQFNEILLLLGYDRVSDSFFQFLVDGKTEYIRGACFNIPGDIETGVERFITLALLWYGNIKFAFKSLSLDREELEEKVNATLPYKAEEYKARHFPIKEIIKIPSDKTFLLGYVVKDNYETILKQNTDDQNAKYILDERLKYLEPGQKNQIAYLSSDHLDVYVATSMRLEHEYHFISTLINDIFSSTKLKNLKIRWFDPTQAYCEDRIDKGLSEALMLNRAKCTLYLIQESDTLGKDSELASTLAQGKPVIAYVPNGDKDYVDSLLKNLKKINPNKSEHEIIVEQLQIFESSMAWKKENNALRVWINKPDKADIDQLKALLYEAVRLKYEKRASTLKETHPLGIQVNLRSGVANGVLVVRDTSLCADLIESILLNKMEFSIEYKTCNNSGEYVLLREKISRSIFRVTTGDNMLTNAFWNFYL